jgi:aspartate carbamoyltransferase catalytic subunit
VDEDERAAYFEQAANGRYIRMALILKLVSESDKKLTALTGEENGELICKNRRCITATERGIKRLFDGARCIYCDQRSEK